MVNSKLSLDLISHTVSELRRFLGQKSLQGYNPVSFNAVARGGPLRICSRKL